MIGSTNSIVSDGVHSNIFLYNNLTNYSHSGNNWDGFAFDNVWVKNNEETLIKRTTIGQNYSITGVETCLVIANLQLCAGSNTNAFGVAFEKTTLNGTIQLSQSGMAPRNDATVIWMGTMKATEKLAWKVYGTFQGPQNYNSSCCCNITAIKIPDY